MVGRWGGEVCGEVDDKFAVDDEIVRGLFQISQDYPILFGETRVDICLHSASVAQLADLCYSAAMDLPMLFDDLF